jgi:hypothetical protein
VTIKSAFIRSSDAIDTKVEIISRDRYNSISNKSDTSNASRPCFLFYDGNYPTGTINLYPAPDMAYTLFLTSLKKYGPYVTTDAVSLPDGYEKLLTYNLAYDICTLYRIPVTQELNSTLIETRARIKRVNLANNIGVIRYEPIMSGNYVYTELFEGEL